MLVVILCDRLCSTAGNRGIKGLSARPTSRQLENGRSEFEPGVASDTGSQSLSCCVSPGFALSLSFFVRQVNPFTHTQTRAAHTHIGLELRQKSEVLEVLE